MKKRILFAILALAMVISTVLPLASCSMPSRGITEIDKEALSTSLEYYERFKGKNITINVFNWGEYISDGSEDDTLNINQAFENLTGITVNYTNFDSNETLYSKLANGGAQYDIIIPSDYMIARMIEENMLEKINLENVPNLSYIEDSPA